ncbi:hypothetical protein BDV11DRAFT_178995 [Aspergillus similis]
MRLAHPVSAVLVFGSCVFVCTVAIQRTAQKLKPCSQILHVGCHRAVNAQIPFCECAGADAFCEGTLCDGCLGRRRGIRVSSRREKWNGWERRVDSRG